MRATFRATQLSLKSLELFREVASSEHVFGVAHLAGLAERSRNMSEPVGSLSCLLTVARIEAGGVEHCE
jgi:hypothetical protein